MRIERLDHVNIVTTRLPDMVAWYAEVLGLKPGARPDFPFPGAWLYAGDHAVVHLVGNEGTPNVGSEVKLKLEHFALSATGLSAFEEKLISSQIQYRKTEVPGARMVQVHVADPDGNHIHIDFEETE
ncbi:VOC family protein [Roseibium sp. RKSG952]|uniref:VOC family protein n=1 Tax=Roseibium sp. RKSG952 TaxID=2529384 RepID=UPI0012BD196C|nr:VOC family protein [Roseibium sp. RKSG952]MTI01374.1 glyoxalase [Roseibium sp. RKSG952]